MNRRKLLKSAAGLGTGLMLADVIRLYTGVQKTILRQAFANSGDDVLSRSYLNFHLSGAPPRFLFDQWLTPNATDITLSAADATTWNPGIATAFDSNNPVYKLMTYKGVQVPSYYQSNITGKNADRPMSDLLDHMAVIRGYNSVTDGHEINEPLQTYPDPGAPSLSGLAADNRKDLIAGISSSLTSARHFHSMNGHSLTTVYDHYATGGSINGLMKAFKATATSRQGLLGIDAVQSVVDQLHEVAQAKASADNARSAAIKDQLSAARKLALMAAEDLGTQWSALFNKYHLLARTSIRNTATTPGFSENAIRFASGEPNSFEGTPVDPAFDMRGAYAAANPVDAMIRNFALAEYCLTKGITGSLSLGFGNMLQELSVVKVGETAVTKLFCGSDQHGTPNRIATVIAAGFYRGFASNLIELIDVLKNTPMVGGGSMFDKTVIHVTGDFARNPRTDQIGSDHAWNGQVASVFSGVVPGPFIVGNIAATGTSGYKGIWGRSALVDFNGSKETLSPRHMAAAVSHLLGGKNPWNFTNLVWQLDSSGRLQPKIGAKIL